MIRGSTCSSTYIAAVEMLQSVHVRWKLRPS